MPYYVPAYLSNKGLNTFGADFVANGAKWDQTLANLDSDGDGYKNGLEIGDEDGDGTPSVTRERKQSGRPFGTPSSLDEHTWGRNKKAFRRMTLPSIAVHAHAPSRGRFLCPRERAGINRLR